METKKKRRNSYELQRLWRTRPDSNRGPRAWEEKTVISLRVKFSQQESAKPLYVLGFLMPHLFFSAVWP